MIRFLTIVSFLLIYTALKLEQIWPEHAITATLITVCFFAFMLGATLIYRRDASVFDRVWFRAFAWTGALAMGAWATFFLISLPIDFVRGVFFAVTKLTGFNLTLSERAAHWFGAGSIALLSIVMAALGYFEVLRGPRVRNVEVPIDNLPGALENFKIAQISDLHVGATVRAPYVNEVVRRTNDAQPDLIVITGDLIDAHASSVRDDMRPLGGLKARHGVFYVTGNHEYYWGAPEIFEQLRSLGFTILMNENRIVEVAANARVLVAGVTDPMGASLASKLGANHVPDVKRALETRESTAVKILLSHRPGFFDEAEPLGAHILFAGHTHSGQFFPFSLLIGLAHKYYRGLAKAGRLWVYVNPGTGYWGPPNRLGIPSEISLIRLKGAK